MQRLAEILVLELGDVNVEGAAPSREILAWLREFGYEPWEARPDGVEPHRSLGGRRCCNVLFAPTR